ncbi:MAG: nicotinate-nucleotide--dimethylbenzimidazole phosphoribosyltransferase [Dongiaceae bacterium]
MHPSKQPSPDPFAEHRQIMTRLPLWNKALAPFQRGAAAIFFSRRMNSAAITLQAQMQNLITGQDPLYDKASALDIDLCAYDLDLAGQIKTHGADEIAHALSYGMMALAPGVEILALASFTTGAPSEVNHAKDGFEALTQSGSQSIAAVMGAIIAARMAGVPVILADREAAGAAQLLKQLRQDAIDHCSMAADMDAALDKLGGLKSKN